MQEVMAVGEWLYDGSVPMVVRIVKLDWDFWYGLSEADGNLEPDQRPMLNDVGHAFYIRFKPGWSEGELFWPDSMPFMTLDEAKREAESKVAGGVRWS